LHTWNATEAGHAGTNAGDNDGFGDAVVYYAGGPGADPNYTPSGYSNTMAYNWGAQQGEDAYSQWLTDSDNSNYSMMPIVWLDMEQTNGWNEWLSTPANGDPPTVTNPCQTNGNYPSDCCNASYDWNVVSGFIFGVGYSSGGGVIGGVYSSYDMWNSETFGCGSCSSGTGALSTTDEWTYQGSPTSLPGLGSHEPNSGWCEEYGGSCVEQAYFFGGEDKGTSSYTVIWQWAGNNSDGDFDQIDESSLGDS
jgi:hypothetical protein